MTKLFFATFALVSMCLTWSARVPPVPVSTKMMKKKSQEKSGLAGAVASFPKNMKRLIDGVLEIIPTFVESQRLQAKRKKSGVELLTYREFKFLQRTKDDFGKGLRLAITLPIAPEFFFYSYIVFPMFSGSNPWAWRAFPSFFDKDPADVALREKIVRERRSLAVLSSLKTLKAETIDDTPEQLRIDREKQIEVISTVLKSSTYDVAMKACEPWLLNPRKAASKLVLNLSIMPGAVIKDCCRAVGIDGLPNIPLVRRLNVGELVGYVDKIREEDQYLAKTGVNKLKKDEVVAACEDRCIFIGPRSEAALRTELDQFVKLSTNADRIANANLEGSLRSSQRRAEQQNQLVINPQNARFAMMCLNAARGVKASGHSTVFKALFE